MPLTPAHAAVAPLLHRLTRLLRFSVPMSALVIGSMTPDFDYLIRLTPGGGVWHTPLGLLVFCLPAGLATWWIFREIIGPALLRLLPPGLGSAAASLVAPGPTYRLIPAAAGAIILGALSHDCWDSFTHEARWGVRQIPGLDTHVLFISSHLVRWYSILQYASSLIGLIIVALILGRWVAAFPQAARHVPVGERVWRIRELSLIVLSGVVGAVLNVSRPHPGGLSWTMGLAAVGALSALAVALLAYGIIDSVRHRTTPGKSVAGANEENRSSRGSTDISNESRLRIVDRP